MSPSGSVSRQATTRRPSDPLAPHGAPSSRSRPSGPLLLLPFDPDSDRVGFYYVPEKKVLSKTLSDVRGKVACGSSCGWLALMDEAASVTLLNPFVGAVPPALSSHQ